LAAQNFRLIGPLKSKIAVNNHPPNLEKYDFFNLINSASAFKSADFWSVEIELISIFGHMGILCYLQSRE
jgi:hypothetical protein